MFRSTNRVLEPRSHIGITYVVREHPSPTLEEGQSSSDASQLPMIHMLVVNITFRNKNAFFFQDHNYWNRTSSKSYI